MAIPRRSRCGGAARPVGIALVSLLVAQTARADAIDEHHSDGFYLARGASVVAAAGATITIASLVQPTRPEPLAREWLPLDDTVRGNFSTAASHASDVTLLMTMATPLVANLAGGFDTRLANTSLLYAEVLAANALLNTVVKLSLPRLRPYNYDGAPPAYIASQGRDAYLSFYSGHTCTAFAAALGGSYLFAAAHPDSVARPWLWGTETALATATAIWRIRAGKHFYSDVAVGFLVGSAIGIGLPLLEGVRYRPSATEVAFAGGGAILGGLTAVLVPFRDDVATVTGSGNLRVQILPSFSRTDVGLAFHGRFD
jgi:membrane-associated phospholipid phosphatase